ncbi:MAG TPA: PAS domain-containing protein [Anaerolineae bacterium]|nr:PAS domain-containing protein [Caldilineae bacterium]HID35193.1 PAS domain-containing protein [Anaerolineae bacterium]HIQ12481.1 PAS domain-containing protein [Caldilineales bacterium]
MSQTQLLALGVLLALLAGAALFWLRERLQRPASLARRIASEVHIIAAANAGHRLDMEELPSGFDELAEAIDALAGRYERLLTSQSQAVMQARTDLLVEHARLIALIGNLAEGVLICDQAGEILLYNPSARALLGEMIGLGRSISDLRRFPALGHALRLMQQQPHPRPRVFVSAGTDGRFLRVRIAPVFDQGREVQGFALTLEDVTAQVQSSDARDRWVYALGRDLRGGLANLRAAIETLREHPDMDAEMRLTLEAIVAGEAVRLSQRMGEALAEYARLTRACWHLEDIALSDLMQVLTQRLHASSVHPPQGADAWVQVDSLALARMLAHVAARADGPPALAAHVQGDHVRIDLIWPADRADIRRLRSVLNEAQVDGPAPAEVASYHGGEIWVQRDRARDQVQLTLLLPRIPLPEPAPPAHTPIIGSRPEFYDFDLLFRRPAPATSMASTPLSRLRYTVFDTETTGLDPDSDEIIAIGAVRIVNARLLEGEAFHQLIRSRRPVPPGATRIHGIRDADLQGAPPLETALPAFHRFARDSVLVAHNVAFDMRFLQAAERRSNVRFRQPVLDTLLISAIVHPEHKDHSIEAIAARLGVPIQDRHSALGDAITTARIFLKLISLLELRGIVTLAQAQEASEQTYFARIRY